MIEQPISNETATLAKQAGFYIDTKGDFSSETRRVWLNPTSYDFPAHYFSDDELLLTNISQTVLQRWLRDIHNIHINLMANYYHHQKFLGYVVNIDVFELRNDNCLWHIQEIEIDNFWEKLGEEVSFQTYENALETGLQTALKLLLKKL